MKVFFGEVEVKENDFVYPSVIEEFIPSIEAEYPPGTKLAIIYYDETNHYLLWFLYNNEEIIAYTPPFSFHSGPITNGNVAKLSIVVIPMERKPITPSRNKFYLEDLISYFPLGLSQGDNSTANPVRGLGETGESISFYSVPKPRDLYLPIKQIGAGVAGRVFIVKSVIDSLVSPETRQKLYAAKYVSAGTDEKSKKNIQGALREIHMLSLIPPHKNIISLIDSGQDQLGTFLIMPLLKHSEELEQFLHNNPNVLTLRQKVNLMLELSDAIKHLHKYKIVHLDLKEANCLIDVNTFTPTLIDFNLSCSSLEGDQYTCEGYKGTPLYMDPNLLLAHKGDKISQQGYLKADIYSLGVIFYKLIVGLHPFYRGDDFKEFKQVMKQYKLIPFTSGNLTVDILIKYMLSKNRPDAEEVYDTLTLILQEI
jgi:serine/threonine protein kinase